MDNSLKQRLIGAIVLVALAVIFLPMLVKGPAPDSGVGQVPIKAPDEPENSEFETRELPLVAPAGSGGVVGMPPTVPGTGAEPSAPADNDAGGLPAAAAGGNYAVTFGAYASQGDADAVIAHLKKAGLPGFSQPDTMNSRQVVRVRIGPYAERSQAELVRLEAAKVSNDVDAQVVVLDATAEAPLAPAPVAQAAPALAPVRSEPLPPAPQPKPEAKPEAKPAAAPVAAARNEPKPESKPAPKVETPKPAPVVAPAAPAASGTGFAVQLGAFAQAADANALRDRVRGAGFSAFVEQVHTEKGTLSRVRVGPVGNRAEAEQLKAQVAAKVGVAGMVRPHP